MHDWRGRWIEQDEPDPPERLRCTRGHFLPRNPTHVRVLSSYEEVAYTMPYSEVSADIKHENILEDLWRCTCGAPQKDA